MKNMKTLAVLVPKPGTRAAAVIDPQSGIVCDLSTPMIAIAHAEDLPEGHRREVDPAPLSVNVYYEGNRYKAENLKAFGDRVRSAAGRLGHYPTTARGVFLRSDFLVVGTFTHAEDWSSHDLTFTDLDALAAWLPLAD